MEFGVLIQALIIIYHIRTGSGKDEQQLLHFRKNGSGGVRKADPGETYFDDKESSNNVTIFRGQTAILTCVVRNIGNKSVSWLRHSYPIPQVIGLNNFTNVKDPRYSALHTTGTDEYVLRIRHSKLSDAGFYECQVAGAITIYKIIRLEIVEPVTQILGGPDIYVDRGSTLNVTCVVYAHSKAPDFIFWSHNNKIILFEGSETSKRSILLRDSNGRFMSRLIIHRIDHNHAGQYTCQPASAREATVTVHVLNGTVLAVSDAEDNPRQGGTTASTSEVIEAGAVGMASATSSGIKMVEYQIWSTRTWSIILNIPTLVAIARLV